jgi:DNA recombination protein RmuC
MVPEIAAFIADLNPVHLGLVILGVAVLTLLAAAFRRPKIDLSPLAAAVETLSADLGRVAADVRALETRSAAEDRDSRQRREIADSFGLARTMLTDALKDLGSAQHTRLDAVADQLAGLSEMTDRRLETFRLNMEQRIAEMRGEAADAALKQRGEVGATLKQQGEELRQNAQAIAEAQRGALTQMTERVGELARTTSEGQTKLRESLDSNLIALRRDNEAKLEQMRLTVDEKLQGTLEARLTASFQTVSDRLESVHKGLGEMQTLASGVGDLKKMLSGVKTRGTFGEEQLGALLDQFLAPEQYQRNARTRPDSNDMVEYAVRLPEGVMIPIDCKYPQEDYDRLLQAVERGDIESIESSAAAMEVRLRGEARKIAAKYVNPPVTTDFAVLYLPIEGLFAEILRRPGLREQILRDHRVVLLGPTTLVAFLSSLQMGFRSLTIQKKSAEVWKILGAVKTEFGKYGDILDKVGKKLGESQNELGRIGVRTRAIERNLRNVESATEAAVPALLDLAYGEGDAVETDPAAQAVAAPRQPA